MATDLIKVRAGRPRGTHYAPSIEINVVIIEVVLNIVIEVLNGAPEREQDLFSRRFNEWFRERILRRFRGRVRGRFLDFFRVGRFLGGIGGHGGHGGHLGIGM